PETAALLNPLRYFGVQSFRLCVIELLAPIADADRRHRRSTGGLKLGIFRGQVVEMLCLADIVVNPLPDLARAVSFEAHPHFQAAKTSRLLESVYVILIALIFPVKLIGEVRRLHPK